MKKACKNKMMKKPVLFLGILVFGVGILAYMFISSYGKEGMETAMPPAPPAPTEEQIKAMKKMAADAGITIPDAAMAAMPAGAMGAMPAGGAVPAGGSVPAVPITPTA